MLHHMKWQGLSQNDLWELLNNKYNCRYTKSAKDDTADNWDGEMLDISNEIPGLLMLPEPKIIFASEAAFFDSRC